MFVFEFIDDKREYSQLLESQRNVRASTMFLNFRAHVERFVNHTRSGSFDERNSRLVMCVVTSIIIIALINNKLYYHRYRVRDRADGSIIRARIGRASVSSCVNYSQVTARLSSIN